MFWLKSCPKCHGDLTDKADIYGGYINCFQCGYCLTVDEDASLRSEKPYGTASFLALTESAKELVETAA
jgi:hypothetical protein